LRPAAAHRRAGVVGRLRRATQGRRGRAGVANAIGNRRHGPDGARRCDRDRRRLAVRGGGAARGAWWSRGADCGDAMIGWLQRPLRSAFLHVEALANRAFGDQLNPFYHLGAITFWLFWLVAASGLYLYIFFD